MEKACVIEQCPLYPLLQILGDKINSNPKFGTVSPETRPESPSESPSAIRKITNIDRSEVLRNHSKGWVEESKESLKKRLGLSSAQVAAIIAWSHPNLGGRMYLKRYTK